MPITISKERLSRTLLIVGSKGDGRVTALAKRHQVVIIVSAAFSKRELVMYFFYRNIPSVLEALFTKRML